MRKPLFLILLLLVTASAFAQDDSWRNRRDHRRPQRQNLFELTPFGGYRYGGTIFADRSTLFTRDVDVASSADFGASFGIPLGDQLKLELMVNRQATHLETGGELFAPDNRLADFDVTYYQAGLQLPFRTASGVEPFIVISAGMANLDPHIGGVTDENRFAASAGIGVKIPVASNVGIRVDARGYFTSLGNDDRRNCSRCSYNYDHDLYQGETSLGVVFRF